MALFRRRPPEAEQAEQMGRMTARYGIQQDPPQQDGAPGRPPEAGMEGSPGRGAPGMRPGWNAGVGSPQGGIPPERGVAGLSGRPGAPGGQMGGAFAREPDGGARESAAGAQPLREGRIGKDWAHKGNEILQKYKQGKANLEKRIIDNEQWYKMRHWEQIRGSKNPNDPQPASAWLFNSIANKHADAMDNFPEPNVLPREDGDKEDATQLSSILPVILEQNEFEQTYSDVWWYKLKTGTGVYGVFWNPVKENGLGDVEIRKLDILNIFWEPGVMDIQKSRNLFTVELVDNEVLEQRYPQLKGKLSTSTVDVAQYVYDDTVDTSEKSAVVDWYYKAEAGEGERLHYIKYVNDQVLYASEDDPNYAERGFYDHGQYPIVLDVMFVEEGTPTGFGYIDVMKDAQMYIDKLNQTILRSAVMGSRKRFFIRDTGGVNEAEFADWSKDFVHVAGSSLGDDCIREITTSPISSIYVNILHAKIEELKETSGNRDFSQGGTTSGVTAASAIAALQEAGSKLSRDMIKASYRAFSKINYMVLELIRQFYTEPRCFRITGQPGAGEFVQYDNRRIRPQKQGEVFGLDLGYRRPLFDIRVTSQKSSPFSKIAQNELAKELYSLGFFNPQMADQALAVVDMMDFEGKEMVIRKIAENGTMQQQLQALQEQMAKMAMIVDAQNGTTISQGLQGDLPEGAPQPSGAGELPEGRMEVNPLGDAVRRTGKETGEKAKQRAANIARPE